jgi:uncharacterized protein YbjQ (UPF0145 family)
MFKHFFILLAVFSLVGCASYRVDSNVQLPPSVSNGAQNKEVLVYERGTLPKEKFKDLKQIEVTVKKLTVFHTDPTKAQANEELKTIANSIGADAVVNVEYKSGIGWFTWGYIDASGMAVKFSN